MRVCRRELYRSAPNGDRWSLVREQATGRIYIEHEPNRSSGGRVSEIEIESFLGSGPLHPEQQALLHLIGTLVGRKGR